MAFGILPAKLTVKSVNMMIDILLNFECINLSLHIGQMILKFYFKRLFFVGYCFDFIGWNKLDLKHP